jgi:voltage-gated potassium channel
MELSRRFVLSKPGQMISIVLTISSLLNAVFHASKDNEFRALGFVVLLVLGSTFYSYAENWSMVDSLYFCAMTVTTIGYGDLTPSSDISKLFTIVYAFKEIGAFADKLAYAMTIHSRRRQMAKEDAGLD